MSSSTPPLQPHHHLFRTVKRLNATTYLVLPPHLPPTPNPDLTLAIEYSTASVLPPTHIPLLSHLRVLKTGTGIRHESTVLEALGHLSSAHLTRDPASSYLVTLPLFGKTLGALGAAYKTGGQIGIPNWFLAHVFHSLLTCVSELHDAGFAHNGLTPSTVVVDPYQRQDDHKYRYRGYPCVQLVEFSSATALDDAGKERDVRAVLEIMSRCVRQWSDSSAFIGLGMVCGGGVMETDDPVMLVLRDVLDFLAFPVTPSLESVLDALMPRLVDTRYTEPMYVSPRIKRLVHDDLVTEGELKRGTSRLVVLTFERRCEEFVRVVAGERTRMGVGGYAGMRTGRVLVVRFQGRREDFGRLVVASVDGIAGGETDGMDVDAKGESE